MIWVTKHAAATKIANGAGTHRYTHTYTYIKHTQTLHLTHLLLGHFVFFFCFCFVLLPHSFAAPLAFAFWICLFLSFISRSRFFFVFGFHFIWVPVVRAHFPLPTSYCATVPHPASLSNLPTHPALFLFYGDVVIVCSVHSHTHSATHAYSNTLRHTWLRIRNNLVTKMLLFRATFLCVCVCMCV